MNAPPHHDDEDDNEQVFLDESDIIHEVAMDNEDLPDADDDSELGMNLPVLINIFGCDIILTISEEEDSNFVHKFTAHTGELYSVSCSPTDAALVVTGSGDDRGFLWKIGQGDWAFELQGHEESVSTLAFSYDGQQLASVSLDGIIKVWDVSGNLEGRNFEGPGGGIEWLRWDPRGHRLLAGSEDFSIWMWNTDNAALLKTFIGHGNSVTCGDFTPDGNNFSLSWEIICTGSDDATLRIWNSESGKSTHVVQGQREQACEHVVDNNALASHSDSIECVGFAPSGSWAAVGGMDKKLIIWDIEHLLPRGTCEHEDGVSCLAWLGASYVASGCVDGKVRLWDSRSGKCVKTLKGHSDAIQSLSVSANHDYLVSASVDGTACAFEVENFR
ncbi:Angio-associated migratory cell protein [Glycine soja]|uniref:Angio-associated migratory cell protein isoform A n=1 Tax=Glycine soja TaxID=3848 RepID=A0A445IQY3_GLYSO|nr:Angio-associated migratory cell protein isoform A [Glycine soja]